jgi:tRNA (Thr-GGU) A37 N-methylase
VLEEIEDFSHIWLRFYLSGSPPPESPRTHPQGRDDTPLVGRFATRSPVRPNLIGMTPVELLAIEGNRLWVMELDALDSVAILFPTLFKG